MVETLKRWSEMADSEKELTACHKRWQALATKIGCTVQGFNDDFSAGFFTPDGNVIEVGPKFRAVLAELKGQTDA